MAAAPKKPAAKDTLLKKEYRLAEPEAKRIRNYLYKMFRKFDARALRLSELYRGSIYWRSMLPMASTVLLATGFYGDSIFKRLTGAETAFFSALVQQKKIGFWDGISAQQGSSAAVKGCGGGPRRIGWTRQRKDKFSMLVSPLFFAVPAGALGA